MGIGDFTAQAEAYHRSRPNYPPALLDALATRLELRPGDAVADIGAGTGIFTRQLAERDYRVSAVEPNQAMRAFAEPHPNVTWHDGTFEASGLAPRSQRWAVAAQAFHWARPAEALAEMARILAPERAFTVVFNDRDPSASPLMAFVKDALAREVPGFDEAYRDRDWVRELGGGGWFGAVEQLEVRHVVPMSRERFFGLWRSHNRLNNIAGEARVERLLGVFARYLDERDEAVVPVAYRCRAWTAWRLPRDAGTGMSSP